MFVLRCTLFICFQSDDSPCLFQFLGIPSNPSYAIPLLPLSRLMVIRTLLAFQLFLYIQQRTTSNRAELKVVWLHSDFFLCLSHDYDDIIPSKLASSGLLDWFQFEYPVSVRLSVPLEPPLVTF